MLTGAGDSKHAPDAGLVGCPDPESGSRERGRRHRTDAMARSEVQYRVIWRGRPDAGAIVDAVGILVDTYLAGKAQRESGALPPGQH